MDKLRVRTKQFRVRPYSNIVHYVVTSEIHRWVAKRFPHVKCSPDAYASTISCGRDIFMVLPERCGLSAIAHESFHVVFSIMEGAGIPLEEEVWAYQLQDIFEEGLQFVYKTKRRKNGKAKKA